MRLCKIPSKFVCHSIVKIFLHFLFRLDRQAKAKKLGGVGPVDNRPSTD